MVVDHSQRVATATIAKRHMALEVHLPEQVRCRHLKAQAGGRSTGRRNDPAMPAQHLMHRRRDRTGQPIALQTAGNLARSPGRMGVAHRKNALLDRRCGPRRAQMRTTGTIREAFIGRPAAEPLVAGIRMNPEPPAQLAPVRPFLQRQSNKLTPLVHDRHLAPRHGWPPCKPNPCDDDVSVMSPNTRRGCLRAIQQGRA